MVYSEARSNDHGEGPSSSSLAANKLELSDKDMQAIQDQITDLVNAIGTAEVVLEDGKYNTCDPRTNSQSQVPEEVCVGMLNQGALEDKTKMSLHIFQAVNRVRATNKQKATLESLDWLEDAVKQQMTHFEALCFKAFDAGKAFATSDTQTLKKQMQSLKMQLDAEQKEHDTAKQNVESLKRGNRVQKDKLGDQTEEITNLKAQVQQLTYAVAQSAAGGNADGQSVGLGLLSQQLHTVLAQNASMQNAMQAMQELIANSQNAGQPALRTAAKPALSASTAAQSALSASTAAQPVLSMQERKRKHEELSGVVGSYPPDWDHKQCPRCQKFVNHQTHDLKWTLKGWKRDYCLFDSRDQTDLDTPWYTLTQPLTPAMIAMKEARSSKQRSKKQRPDIGAGASDALTLLTESEQSSQPSQLSFHCACAGTDVCGEHCSNKD